MCSVWNSNPLMIVHGTSSRPAESLVALKRRVDPENRFRFHPFARIIG